LRKLLTVLAALVAAVAFVAVPASAITDGAPDLNGHPNVGLMVAKNAAGVPLWRCSGTMIAATKFLTAGHCTDGAASVAIWFGSGYPDQIPRGTGYPAAGPNPCAGITGYPCTGDASGTPYTHPQYDPNAFVLHDVGVVVLSASRGGPYASLPSVGQLNGLKTQRGQQDVTFTAVGYGLQKSFPDAAAWKEQALRTRMVAYPKLNQINVPGFTGDFSMLLSNNANTGGTCFGDSGGPNFLGDSNIVAGVTSFAINGNCAGTGGVFRMDREGVNEWVSSFLD
jgi:hypothetical protein